HIQSLPARATPAVIRVLPVSASAQRLFEDVRIRHLRRLHAQLSSTYSRRLSSLRPLRPSLRACSPPFYALLLARSASLSNYACGLVWKSSPNFNTGGRLTYQCNEL